MIELEKEIKELKAKFERAIKELYHKAGITLNLNDEGSDNG